MKKGQQDTIKHFLQQQPRSLTMARHKLGIHQMRVMVRIVKCLQSFMAFDVDHSKKQEDLWVTIKISELVVGNNVKPLREALKCMMSKLVVIEYNSSDGKLIEVGTPIIKEYKYEHGSSTVDLQISGNLLPQIIDLARGYTRYSIDVAFKTSSPNTFKLYQYVSSFRDKKQIQCNLKTLRHWLQIEDKYSMPSKIKEWILLPAMKELKENADVWFDIAERVTQGRRMVGWKFNIYVKKGTKERLLNSSDSKDEEFINALKNKYGLSENQAKKVIEKVPRIELNKELYSIQLRLLNREIKNIGGYTVSVLAKKFSLSL